MLNAMSGSSNKYNYNFSVDTITMRKTRSPFMVESRTRIDSRNCSRNIVFLHSSVVIHHYHFHSQLTSWTFGQNFLCQVDPSLAFTWSREDNSNLSAVIRP